MRSGNVGVRSGVLGATGVIYVWTDLATSDKTLAYHIYYHGTGGNPNNYTTRYGAFPAVLTELLGFGGVMELAGFVDDAGEFVDDALATEGAGVGDADEGEMGAAEEFFHVFRAATEVAVAAGVVAFVDFDGADRTEGAFVAKNEVNRGIFDEAVSFVAILGADFVAEEGRNGDFRDDVEGLAENFVE